MSVRTGQRGESGRFGISNERRRVELSLVFKTKPSLTGKTIVYCLSTILDLLMAASSEALLAEVMAVRKRALKKISLRPNLSYENLLRA